MQAIHTKNAPEAIGPYSQAVQVDNWIFLSGQIPINPQTGDLVKGGIAQETKQVMENLRAVIEAAGGQLSDMVKTTIYITDLNHFNQVNQVYETFFSPPYQARACIQVAALPKGVRVEIDGIVKVSS